jgi:hypothetical protein
LVYRRHENVQALAPVTAAVPSGGDDWNAWFAAGFANHFEPQRTAMLDAVAHTVAKFTTDYVHEKLGAALVERDREIASLKGENAEIRGMLGSALSAIDKLRKAVETEKRERQIRDETIRERGARIADLQRDNAVSHAELARQQRDQELAARDHRIGLLEVRLEMLLRHLSMSDLGLPRGI